MEGITARRQVLIRDNTLIAGVVPVVVQPVHTPGILIFGRIEITGECQVQVERGDRRRQFDFFRKRIGVEKEQAVLSRIEEAIPGQQDMGFSHRFQLQFGREKGVDAIQSAHEDAPVARFERGKCVELVV